MVRIRHVLEMLNLDTYGDNEKLDQDGRYNSSKWMVSSEHEMKT